MSKLKLKGKKEKKLIWSKVRYYVDFLILICCFIIMLNIHPLNNLNNSNNFTDNNLSISAFGKYKMTYIFHDYEWNEYIMNDDNIHWTSNSWDYLFDDEVPNDLKWDDKKNIWSVSIWELPEWASVNNQTWIQQNDWTFNEKDINPNSVKDNQVSIGDIASDLWITDIGNEKDSSVIIDAWDYKSEDELYEDFIYIVRENTGLDNNSLIIEKFNNSWDEENMWIVWQNDEATDDNELSYNEDNNTENFVNKQVSSDSEGTVNDEGEILLIARAFTFIDEWWVLPTLVPRNDLLFEESNQTLSHINGYTSNESSNNWYPNTNGNKKSGITIIEDYADCMTPWWYKIKHWDSILAYKQMDNAPDICNIERRFCWKWKLSGTYTQQWCSINKNYTYEQRWEAEVSATKQWWNSGSSPSTSKGTSRSDSKENNVWTTTDKNSETSWVAVFDEPNGIYTDFTWNSDNIRSEDEEVELSERPHRNCTTPRWEKVKHWQFVQAFKHKNWFSDMPCEAQFRLCTIGDLMWTYTEPSCKTWDTSFVDWVYGSPTRETYSEWKLKLVKEQMESDEKKYNRDRKKIWRLENDDDFDELLYILDDNY